MGRGLTFTEWMGNKGLVGCLSHERKVLKENAERRPESRKCTLLHTIVNWRSHSHMYFTSLQTVGQKHVFCRRTERAKPVFPLILQKMRCTLWKKWSTAVRPPNNHWKLSRI